jgi:hypothetical protein
MRIDRLLQRNMRVIVAPCLQERHELAKGTDIMENTYIDIQAHIAQANQLRSQAMGEMLAAGWTNFTQWLKAAPTRLARHTHRLAGTSYQFKV